MTSRIVKQDNIAELILPVLALLNICFFTGFLTSVSASTDIIDTIELTVPVACTMSGTGQTSHNSTLNPGTYSGASGSEYEAGIGKTTLTTYCNDNNGFSIYAIGFTGDLYEGESHTKLIGQNTNQTISTKVYANGDTDSNWSMKVTKVDNPASGNPITYNPDNMSIQNSFNSWHTVPDVYTKVAQYNSSTTDPATTDTTLGAKIETTYATYISSSQPADTYTGQVKYTMVHPYDEQPLQPQTANSGCINYFPNGSNVEGTMGCQTVSSSATSAILLASNYSKQGYGFAGWSDVFDYTTNPSAHFYGPQEVITFEAGQYTGSNSGLSLYAVWIKSEGTLQDANKVATLCGTSQGSLTAATYTGNPEDQTDWSITANLSSVSALTDTRDNQTYAIAKLSDGKCWTIENLRLSDTHQEGNNTVPTILTTTNTNNPLNDGTLVTLKHNYADTESHNTLSPSSNTAYNSETAPEGWCSASSAECIDQSRVRTDNTTNRAVNPTSNSNTNLYGLGNYYNWYSATAGWGTYSKSSGSTAGDICPTGWHIPTGNVANATSAGEMGLLANSLGGYKNANNVPQTMNSQTTPTHMIMIQRMQHFPNNFVMNGYTQDDTILHRGARGSYWTSTASSQASMCILYYYYNSGYSMWPGISYDFKKYSGRGVRCTANL